MSIMVKKLYKNGSFLYKMNLIAGQGGLNNLVQWVHIIEDDAATSFLHGNELVFTAGILNQNEHWLLQFAQRLHNVGTSAFVVNIGPHIHSIPDPDKKRFIAFWEAMKTAGYIQSDIDISKHVNTDIYKTALDQLKQREPQNATYQQLDKDFSVNNL